jgi:competence protein CoiA
LFAGFSFQGSEQSVQKIGVVIKIMLSAIRVSDTVQVLAFDEERGKESYQCPECKTAVVLKKCKLKVDHFAHKPPVTCVYGKGESEIHRRSKMEIYQALESHTEVTKLRLERGLETIRPDISFQFGVSYVAFEVQLSALTVEKIIRRTEEYGKKKRIALLWLAQWSDQLLQKPYTPSAWEKWIHAAYYGRVYYWKGGLTVVPCHFGECYLWKKGSEWYSSEGKQQSAGFYWRKSKKFVVPILGPKMNLLQDFKDETRPGRKLDHFPIPDHKIWTDKHIWTWPEILKPDMQPKNPYKAAISIDGEIVAAPDED